VKINIKTQQNSEEVLQLTFLRRHRPADKILARKAEREPKKCFSVFSRWMLEKLNFDVIRPDHDIMLQIDQRQLADDRKCLQDQQRGLFREKIATFNSQFSKLQIKTTGPTDITN